jgi:hypothetical protein
MLTKLIPSQVAQFWNVIKYSLEQSLPPIAGDSPERMNRILASCLSGTSDVWVSYERTDDNVKFNGIAVTRILFDDVSYTRSLLIYSLFGYGKFETREWLLGLKSLADYAKSKRCSQIVAYTDNQQIVSLVKRLGGESRYFVSFNKII